MRPSPELGWSQVGPICVIVQFSGFYGVYWVTIGSIPSDVCPGCTEASIMEFPARFRWKWAKEGERTPQTKI
jgi:hypothetical protein